LWGKKQKEKKVEEYIPQEEISEEQERMTIVSLYYLDEQATTLKKEDRLVDVKSLVNNPYETLFNLLKEKPKAEVVTAFSGILELSRRNKVNTSQEELFGDIVVQKSKRKEEKQIEEN